MRKIILGSGSPRRKEILKTAGYDFTVVTADVDENVTEDSPEATVMAISARKAESVAKLVADNGEKDFLVIGADTLVFLGSERMGKPGSEEEACEYLRRLSGNTHKVITGVSLYYDDEEGNLNSRVFSASTEVDVARLSQEEIEQYAASGEPMDKAGAYAIQGQFGKYITAIRGEYNNVVGFPIAAFYKNAKDLLNERK